MKAKFTVLGGNGFIGRHLVSHLKSRGHEVEVPPRDISSLRGQHLGHAVYAIGLTANFRTRPYETVQAHVDLFSEILQGTSFDSLLYLSSTRVYGGARDRESVTEDAKIEINPSADAVYDLSKLLGESLCLASGLPTVRIARLANVYGPGMSPGNFLGSLLHDLATRGEVSIGEAAESSKDYISIEDVVQLLELISLKGRERTYNLSSGRPITHGELAALFTRAGYRVNFGNGPIRTFPRIENSRVAKEFAFSLRSLLDDMPELLETLKKTPL